MQLTATTVHSPYKSVSADRESPHFAVQLICFIQKLPHYAVHINLYMSTDSYHTIQSILRRKDHPTATNLLLGAANAISLMLPPSKSFKLAKARRINVIFVRKIIRNKNIMIRYPVVP